MCITLADLVILGSIPGTFFLKTADTGLIKVIFGFVIIWIGLEMLFREVQTKKVKQSKVVLSIIGIFAGVLCSLYGIGALLSAYVSRVTENSHAFKANMCVVFLVENTFRLSLYSLWGIITLEVLKQAFILMPLMLVGLGLGMLSSKALDEKIIKKIVIVMLMVSGVALVINSL